MARLAVSGKKQSEKSNWKSDISSAIKTKFWLSEEAESLNPIQPFAKKVCNQTTTLIHVGQQVFIFTH